MIISKRLNLVFLDERLRNLILKREFKVLSKLGFKGIEKLALDAQIDETIELNLEDKDNEYNKLTFIIVRKIDKKVIGDIEIYHTEKNTIELGYEIIKSYRRKGYGSEAVKELIVYVKDTYPDIDIVAKCFIDNKASIALLNKLGMIEEDRDCSLIYYKFI